MAETRSKLHVEFFTQAQEDKAASREAGRAIFKDLEMIRIRFAGDKNRIIVERADTPSVRDPATNRWMTYAERFPLHYEAFKKNVEYVGSGTPLSEAPFLTEAKRAELRALNIHTIEALIDIPHRDKGKLGMQADSLINQAKAFVESATGTAANVRLVKENEEMKSQMALMQQQLAELMQGKATAKAPAPSAPTGDKPVDGSPFANWQDADIRNWIKDNGGENPAPRCSHDTLVRIADALNEQLAKEAA